MGSCKFLPHLNFRSPGLSVHDLQFVKVVLFSHFIDKLTVNVGKFNLLSL